VLTDIDGAWWLVVEALKRSAMSRLGRGPPVTAMVSPTVNPLTNRHNADSPVSLGQHRLRRRSFCFHHYHRLFTKNASTKELIKT